MTIKIDLGKRFTKAELTDIAHATNILLKSSSMVRFSKEMVELRGILRDVFGTCAESQAIAPQCEVALIACAVACIIDTFPNPDAVFTFAKRLQSAEAANYEAQGAAS